MKDYIEQQYRLAVLDYRSAHNEEEQWQARKTLAKLELLASEKYGFSYTDKLHALIDA